MLLRSFVACVPFRGNEWKRSVPFRANEWKRSVPFRGNEWKRSVPFRGNEWKRSVPFRGNEWKRSVLDGCRWKRHLNRFRPDFERFLAAYFGTMTGKNNRRVGVR